MNRFTVNIPDENYTIVEFVQEELPGVMLVNSALRDFQPKEVFEWHLSVMLSLEELIENGMPSIDERKLIDPFGDRLDHLIKGQNKEKPNALFLARITWNTTRELIWRVYDPEPVNQLFQEIVEKENAPRPFDYRLEFDKEWTLAEWHLKAQ